MIIAAQTMDGFFNSIESQLRAIGSMVAVIALLILGIRMLMSMKKGDGMREAFQGFGLIAVAALIIGSATGVAPMLIDMGTKIGGKG
ncbi:hypothetical protein [Streptomyces sclerotialus]|uniref:hypothetical protein n=1 Tax=Streptomyces sclerotialus TaxID=1957 RepID=UPI0004C74EC7